MVASLSTAGGIKVGTFIIVILSVISFLRRSDEVRVFNHAVSERTTFKALAVISITGMLICIGLFSLLALEPKLNFLDLMFEAVSAACTVGLSRGVTGELQPASLIILMLLMFAGRFRAADFGLFNRHTTKKAELNIQPQIFKLDKS